MWLYEGREFTSEDIGDSAGFVYEITDLSNGKKYIGKKNFWQKRMLPPLKGKKRRRKKITESNWKEYYGSSDLVNTLLEEKGPENFKREILKTCKTKGDMSYWELKYQVDFEVLFKEEYYNEFIGAKIHSKHLSQDN